ncbi:metallophosphoesterase family protein [Oceanibacterium hippocampi]|uniref:Putative metallophosphoesterase YhaO n=1 Tax=Oceanibacterium hippocampi TaxID=745714 RepID=A0A1Y5TWW4_9PROT|nr:DNA repair exonuclease [Oceanibacterium hippocampi]SLN75700.1 putative metallophosphoesterase YhaO [Oceanibacterium hippocampi]
MGGSFRFLHAADVHLDSPLRGLSRLEGIAVERIRTATRAALSRMVSIAIEEAVAFVVIAGDLYDGDWRDFRTGLFFAAEMGRLNEAGIAVYLLHGNHDAESQITRQLTLPANVHVFDTRRPQSFRHGGLDVALHGQSFATRDVTDNLALDYPAPDAGLFNIGVLHTGLGGMGGHANYAPCAIQDLENRGYDYWALGHVHQAAVLREKPHVVFPGNLQGRHIRETGPKGAMLVSVEDGEVSSLETVPCDTVRWALVPVAVDGASSFGAVLDRIGRALDEAVRAAADGRLLACRVVLGGRTEAHPELIVAGEKLLTEAQALALGLGNEVAWVEKVMIETATVQAPVERADAIGELRSMLEAGVASGELPTLLGDDLRDFMRALPHDLRAGTEDPVLRAILDDDPGALIREIGPYLAARLAEGEG